MFGHAGKVLGGFIGFAAGTLAGGPWPLVFALLGILAGALYDGFHNPDDPFAADRAPSLEEIDREARSCLAASFSQVIQAVLGRALAPVEVAAARSFFVEHLGFDDDDRPDLERVLASPFRDTPMAATCAQACEWTQESERLLLLEGLYAVASAAGPLSAAVTGRLEDAVELLGVQPEDAAFIRRRYRREALESYQLLGLAPDASVQEIRRAYRALAARHHPDRVAHLGAAAMASAAQRFAEVRRAYERVRADRGF